MIAAPLLIALLAQAPVLTLDDALKAAQERNLDLKIAQARLDQSQLIARRVWAGYLPQITVGGTYTRNSVEAVITLPKSYVIRDLGRPSSEPSDPSQPPGIGNPPGNPTTTALFPAELTSAVIQPLNQLGAQANLTQAILAPALWPAIHSAYLAEHAASLNVENARREIFFGVAQLYYGAAALQQAIAVQKRLLETNINHEKDAKVRFQAGASPKVAMLRAEIDRVRAEQDLKRSQNNYASAKVALATLLDRSPDFEVTLPAEPTLPADVNALAGGALEHRPDVQAAGVLAELARSNRTVTILKYLPNLGLVANYRVANATGFTGKYDAWSVGLGLNWTIWDGGLREVELRENGAKVVEAEALRRQTELRATEEVRRVMLDLESARANKIKAAEQLALARENSQLVQVSYNAGAATYLEVADANAALFSAETGAVSESLNAALAALKLLKAAGTFVGKP